jgi:glutamate-1-semialdehyde 2,1-aminomutase
LGGGFPVGVICGQSRWMKRFQEKRPGDICFARGTFNAHPYVMGAMNVFLKSLDKPEVKATYAVASQTWTSRKNLLNDKLRAAGVPVRVAGMETVWSVLYESPSRYHWLLKY